MDRCCGDATIITPAFYIYCLAYLGLSLEMSSSIASVLLASAPLEEAVVLFSALLSRGIMTHS